MPSFIEISGLGAAVSLPPDQHLQGVSLAPLLHNPPATGVGLRQYAFSQFAKSMIKSPQSQQELPPLVPWDECEKCDKRTLVTNLSSTDKDTMHAIEYMGYSLREDRWRFTEWIKWEPRTLRPLWNSSSAPFNAIELYDHAGDFGASMDVATDKVNLAHEPQWASVVTRLRAVLRVQFKGDHEPPQQQAAAVTKI